MIKVTGKGGISATIVTHSISHADNKQISTAVLEYPRFIHAEAKTHRIIDIDDDELIIIGRNDALMSDPMLSRNAASSRAIPINKVIEQIESNPAMPIHWGKNQSGMQAKSEVPLTDSSWSPDKQWLGAANDAICSAYNMSDKEHCDLHKQVVNRILEPYQFIKVVVTATELDNFFYLRDHGDAQPEIAELARCWKEALAMSTPNVLRAGEWHLPFIQTRRDDLELSYYTDDNDLLSLKDAIKVSASLCAQVSYRLGDSSLEKALFIYDKLVTMSPVHASPFEHQATPMECPTHESWMANPKAWEQGITHMDRDQNMWSGNLQGWIQNRQLIPNHVYNG